MCEGRMARAGVPSFLLPHGITEREGDTGVRPAPGPEPCRRRLEPCCVSPLSPSPLFLPDLWMEARPQRRAGEGASR